MHSKQELCILETGPENSFTKLVFLLYVFPRLIEALIAGALVAITALRTKIVHFKNRS